ncbi:MAG: hypothetical protein ACHQF2_09560, partial [Flavobacteriales bacterium]
MFKRSLIAAFVCLVLLTLLTVFANSCNQPQDEKRKPVEKEKPIDVENVEIEEEAGDEILPDVNDSLTDIARFISGIMPEKSLRLKKLAKDSTWKKYSSFIDLQWKKFERDRLVF